MFVMLKPQGFVISTALLYSHICYFILVFMKLRFRFFEKISFGFFQFRLRRNRSERRRFMRQLLGGAKDWSCASVEVVKVFLGVWTLPWISSGFLGIYVIVFCREMLKRVQHDDAVSVILMYGRFSCARMYLISLFCSSRRASLS